VVLNTALFYKSHQYLRRPEKYSGVMKGLTRFIINLLRGEAATFVHSAFVQFQSISRCPYAIAKQDWLSWPDRKLLQGVLC
jgi:hypothetical protein